MQQTEAMAMVTGKLVSWTFDVHRLERVAPGYPLFFVFQVKQAVKQLQQHNNYAPRDTKVCSHVCTRIFLASQSSVQWQGLAEDLDFSIDVSGAWAQSIEARYKDVPYHSRFVAAPLLPLFPLTAAVSLSLLCSFVCTNSTHGADVCQAVQTLMVIGGLGVRLTPLQRMALLVAAAAHDVGK